MFIRVPGRLQESPWEGEERAREWDADRSQDSLLQEWKSRSHNFTFVWWRLPLLDQPCDTFVISLFLAGHEAFSLSYRKGKSDRIAKERKACDSRTCKRESSTVIPSFSAVGWAKRMEGKITYVWMRQRSGNQKDEKEETAVASSSTNHVPQKLQPNAWPKEKRHMLKLHQKTVMPGLMKFQSFEILCLAVTSQE